MSQLTKSTTNQFSILRLEDDVHSYTPLYAFVKLSADLHTFTVSENSELKEGYAVIKCTLVKQANFWGLRNQDGSWTFQGKPTVLQIDGDLLHLSTLANNENHPELTGSRITHLRGLEAECPDLETYEQLVRGQTCHIPCKFLNGYVSDSL